MPALQKSVSGSAVTSGRLIKLEGVPEALESTARLIKSFSSRQFKKEVCFPAAAPGYYKAKADAPYDERRQERVSRGWITQRLHLRDAIFMAYGDDNKPNVLVGVNSKIAPHAHMIEYGWVHKPGGIPFLRPAQSATRSQATSIMAQKLREFPDRVLKK